MKSDREVTKSDREVTKSDREVTKALVFCARWPKLCTYFRDIFGSPGQGGPSWAKWVSPLNSSMKTTTFKPNLYFYHRIPLRCKISLLWCQLCPHIFKHLKLCRISSMTLRSTWMARTWWWGCRRPRMTSWIEIDYVVFEYDTWYVFVFGVKLCQEKSFGYIFMSLKRTWRSWTGWRGFTGPRLTSKEWNCNLSWSEGVFFNGLFVRIPFGA